MLGDLMVIWVVCEQVWPVLVIIAPENGFLSSWEVPESSRAPLHGENTLWRPIFPISLGVFGVQMEGMLGDLVMIWGVCGEFWPVLRLKQIFECLGGA